MANKILFVFEGESTELKIIKSLKKHFVNENTTVESVFGGEIYQIYKEIASDEDLDTFNLLKERKLPKNEILRKYTRTDFAEIYLFFDYDGHSSLADDDKLLELLDFFNEETEKGKLYISYPMAEALKHIVNLDDFKNLCIECKTKISYKSLVDSTCLSEYRHMSRFNAEIWKTLINVHLKKVNYLMTDLYVFPDNIYSQKLIFTKQLEKFITIESKVAVLSAFPVFLLDYYGWKQIRELIEIEG